MLHARYTTKDVQDDSLRTQAIRDIMIFNPNAWAMCVLYVAGSLNREERVARADFRMERT